MQDVHPTPGGVRKEVRIAREKRSAHALHHEQAGTDDRKAGEQYSQMIKLVLKRIFGEFAGLGGGLAQGAADSARSVFEVLAVRPDGPKVQNKSDMEDVVEDGNGQHDAGDPVVSDPGKLNAELRKEGGEQQGQHSQRHDAVKQASAERVPVDPLRNG